MVERPVKTFIGQIWCHTPMRMLGEPGITEEIVHRYVLHNFVHEVFSMSENAVALHHVRQQQIQLRMNELPRGEGPSALKKNFERWTRDADIWKDLKEGYEKEIVESDKRLLPEDQGHQK